MGARETECMENVKDRERDVVDDDDEHKSIHSERNGCVRV